MATAEEQARAYLDQALREADLQMKVISETLNLNHAYLQQYIKRGKPRWLPEPIREGLVSLVPNLDGDRLRPPPPILKSRVNPEGARRKGENEPQIDTPSQGEFIKEPSVLQLVRAYRKIRRPDRRALVLQVAESFADESGSAVA